MGWPRYGEDISPEFWGLDKESQERKALERQKELQASNESAIQLAIQLELRKKSKRDIIIGVLVGLAISITAIGTMTLICLAFKFLT